MSNSTIRSRLEALKNGISSEEEEEDDDFYNEEEEDNFDEEMDDFVVEDQGIPIIRTICMISHVSSPQMSDIKQVHIKKSVNPKTETIVELSHDKGHHSLNHTALAEKESKTITTTTTKTNQR